MGWSGRSVGLCLGLLLGASSCASSGEVTTEDGGVEVGADAGRDTRAPDDTGLADVVADAPLADAAVGDVGDAGDAGDAAADAVEAGDAADGGIKAKCFGKISVTGGSDTGPDYDKFSPVVGSHCWGTNHQDVKGVEQVVFLGDSVTVGTPNTAHALSADNAHFYRNLLAEHLATTFSLDKGGLLDWGLWKTYDYAAGTGGKVWSGAFGDCAKWGARTDDFLAGGGQLTKCFPSGGSAKKTLFVFTMGGNDISALTKLGAEATDGEVAAGYPAAWAEAKSIVKFLDEAIAWVKDPVRFPKGSFVVMANPYEFTDGTGEVSACTGASIVGYKSWKKPDVQRAIVVFILESYMEIAVKRKVDLIWSLEHFCGHGFVSTKASSPPPGACWLGPGAPVWFDETCIHPNDAGHKQLFTMFRDVIAE